MCVCNSICLSPVYTTILVGQISSATSLSHSYCFTSRWPPHQPSFLQLQLHLSHGLQQGDTQGPALTGADGGVASALTALKQRGRATGTRNGDALRGAKPTTPKRRPGKREVSEQVKRNSHEFTWNRKSKGIHMKSTDQNWDLIWFQHDLLSKIEEHAAPVGLSQDFQFRPIYKNIIYMYIIYIMYIYIYSI